MQKPISSRRIMGTTLILAMMLVVGYAVRAERLNSELLRTDPDRLPASPALVRHALAAGRSVYRSYCRDCHQKDGSGDTARGVPVLSDSDWLYGSGSVSDIERIVSYGIRSDNPKAWNLAVMPAFGRLHPNATNAAIPPLEPPQIRDVIELLLQKQGKPADVAAAVRGQLVYQSVGACYDCHSPDAQGDNAIGAPNLTDTITLYGNGDRGALYDSIANGRQGVCPAWIGTLSPLAIREVALYVYELSHRPLGGLFP